MKKEMYGFNDLDIFAQNRAVCELINIKLPKDFVEPAAKNIVTSIDKDHNPYDLAFDILEKYAIEKSIRFNSNGNIIFIDEEPNCFQSLAEAFHTLYQKIIK